MSVLHDVKQKRLNVIYCKTICFNVLIMFANGDIIE